MGVTRQIAPCFFGLIPCSAQVLPAFFRNPFPGIVFF